MKKINLVLKAILIPFDILAIVLAFTTAYFYRSNGFIIYLWPFYDFLRFVLTFSLIWIAIFTLLGLYSFRIKYKFWDEISKILIGSLSGWSLFIVLIYFIKSEQTLALPRLVLALSLFLIPAYIIMAHYIINLIAKFIYLGGKNLTKIKLIGTSNRLSEHIIQELNKSLTDGYIYCGIISNKTIDEIIFKLKKSMPDEIWLLDNNILHIEKGALINFCEEKNINIKVIPQVYEIRTLNVKIDSFAGITFLQFLRSPLEGWGRIVKRFIDIVFSILILIILLPLYITSTILVLISSTGPILYTHKRIGQDGKIFKIYKFRSMFVGAEDKYQHHWSVKDESSDPRITPVGKFLRKTNLDELPQIINVLKGDMSFVGPRPEQQDYVEKFSLEIPHYMKRHYVKSGVTGWAQINGLRGDTSVEERVKYDLFYIQHWSLWFDFRIIIRTIKIFILQIIGKKI